MKKIILSITIGVTLMLSCTKKNENKFRFIVTHYASEIEIELPKTYDTLNIWKRFSDNPTDDKKYYRIQDSKLGIIMEKGYFYETDIKYFKHFTIKEPLDDYNKMYPFKFSDWSQNLRNSLLEEKPSYKINIDSILINKKKFGIVQINHNYDENTDQTIVFGTNINNELIEFAFYTNLPNQNHFYSEAIEAMRTIKIKQAKL